MPEGSPVVGALDTPARWSAPVWLSIMIAAPPVAWASASLGYRIAATSPARDIAALLLWSAGEEIVFRGGVQTALARVPAIATRCIGQRGWLAVGLANLVTSVLFSVAHLWSKPLMVAVAVFPVSLLLGESLRRSGRLAVPVALHAYFNLLLYGASVLAAR